MHPHLFESRWAGWTGLNGDGINPAVKVKSTFFFNVPLEPTRRRCITADVRVNIPMWLRMVQSTIAWIPLSSKEQSGQVVRFAFICLDAYVLQKMFA